ncbi:hypothetical protein PV05_09343 [Exophiala xenobiotica]|uniref:DUF7702 domain-containing protein n=1 Tax=Exophiala xenobiotica TaxID=348802 RepID=A0A0D2CL61_9EURO|nr:uncharacterized protein PV05_09343 [Exophiala xenobiotica]KIW50542.1 hypothetical protein PV05_09343 [Exophiala xenobiotica]
MMLAAFEILAICELIFFFPAFLVSIAVVYKHGAGKRLGWRFLVMISLFRVVGAICAIVLVESPSSGVTISYDIMNNFGLSAIIYTALGLLGRVEAGMEGHGLPFQLFRVLGLPGLAGLVLSIVGATNLLGDNPSNTSSGFAELKAAVMLFLAVYVADIFITVHGFLKAVHVRAGERRLLYAVLATLPFMAVRMIYSILSVFASRPKYFNSWSLEWSAILVRGLMGVLMEVIIVTLFIIVGFVTAAVVPKPAPVRDGKVSPPPYDLKEGSA